MISEGSCDTEDWSNDAENSALNHRNKLHYKIYSKTQLCSILLYFVIKNKKKGAYIAIICIFFYDWRRVSLTDTNSTDVSRKLFFFS